MASNGGCVCRNGVALEALWVALDALWVAAGTMNMH